MGLAGVKFSLQKLQDLAFFFKGSSQYGHIKRDFLQVLQNLTPLSNMSNLKTVNL